MDKNSDKRKILNDVSRCIKTVYLAAANSQQALTVPLNVNSQLIQSIDRSFQHGLLNLVRGYWSLVRSVSHAHTLQTIETWTGAQASPRAKGQAWLLATLVDGSLPSYLQCIVADGDTLKSLYAPYAILRDSACVSQLSALLASLESINLTALKNSATVDTRVNETVEDLCPSNMKAFLDLNLEGIMTSSIMTSSLTSSLASPGDSGFTQIDSETDTASLSEIAMDFDSCSTKEGASLPPDDVPVGTKFRGAAVLEHQSEPMTTSDIANGNINSVSGPSCAPGTYVSDVLEGVEVETESNSDEIVYRRPKGHRSKSTSTQQKRVSFHELSAESSSDEKPEQTSLMGKKAETFVESVKLLTPKISQTVSDLSSLSHEFEGVEIGKDSSILGNDGIEEIMCSTSGGIQGSRGKFELVCTPQKNRGGIDTVNARSIMSAVKTFITRSPIQNDHVQIPLPERGTPEGQEDPPQGCSSVQSSKDVVSSAVSQKSSDSDQSVDAAERLRDLGSVSPVPSCSSLRPQISSPRRVLSGPTATTRLSNISNTSVLSETPSKKCLVNRFLRSITERKLSNCRAALARSAVNKRYKSLSRISLYIPGVKPVPELLQEITAELKEEVCESINQQQDGLPLPDLLVQVADNPVLSNEVNISKVLRVQSATVNNCGMREGLLAILTKSSLLTSDSTCVRQHNLHHSDIDSILVGPWSQWIVLISKDGALKMTLVMGEKDCVEKLVSGIELAARRNIRKLKELPAVRCLSLEDLSTLPSWSAVLQGEKIIFYSVVHTIKESITSAPIKKAYFMFRVTNSDSSLTWEPGYFVLKAGILYQFSDEEEVLPERSIPLNRVSCRHCDVVSRPHTIEVAHWQLAAPDHSVASDWVRALQQASSEASTPVTSAGKCNGSLSSGSLLLTDSRFLLLSSLGIPWDTAKNTTEPCKLTIALNDVAALHMGADTSCWCVVESICCGANETRENYLIFFSTRCEMLIFKEKIWSMCPNLIENTKTIPERDLLRIHCEAVASKLSSRWSVSAPTNRKEGCNGMMPAATASVTSLSSGCSS